MGSLPTGGTLESPIQIGHDVFVPVYGGDTGQLGELSVRPTGIPTQPTMVAAMFPHPGLSVLVSGVTSEALPSLSILSDRFEVARFVPVPTERFPGADQAATEGEGLRGVRFADDEAPLTAAPSDHRRAVYERAERRRSKNEPIPQQMRDENYPLPAVVAKTRGEESRGRATFFGGRSPIAPADFIRIGELPAALFHAAENAV